MEKNLYNFENIKANTIKTKHSTSTTLSTNLLESNVTVIEDKAFIGFTEKDKENIKILSSNNNNSLFVKKDINALNSISCGDKIYIGYTNFTNLNTDTNLHVNGDSEINGNLYVYNDIVVNKNLYTCCNLNVGYENCDNINNDYILNINGQSNFKDNIYVAKSILIEDNIVANKESYLNSIYLNTNIKLDKEIIENINITNQPLSSDDKLSIINNIVNSLYHLKDFTFKGIAFNNGDDTFNNGIASVSKKIIVNKQKYYVFLLINFITHPKIKNIINPITDSFTIIDSDFNKINLDLSCIKLFGFNAVSFISLSLLNLVLKSFIKSSFSPSSIDLSSTMLLASFCNLAFSLSILMTACADPALKFSFILLCCFSIAILISCCLLSINLAIAFFGPLFLVNSN